MIILLSIIGTIVGLILLLLIAALFIKKETIIEREVTINKNKETVFDYVKHINNMDKYSVWNMTDPNSKKEYKGTDGTVGYIYKWDSENKSVGAGEQEIKKIANGERIDMELRFKRPFEGISQTYMSTTANGAQTKVKWAFMSVSKYPMNLMSAMMAGTLGKAMETSLGNLKKILEQ